LEHHRDRETVVRKVVVNLIRFRTPPHMRKFKKESCRHPRLLRDLVRCSGFGTLALLLLLLQMFVQGTQKERPLTHDLLAIILRALGAKIERVIVNDLKRGTYFARLVLSGAKGDHPLGRFPATELLRSHSRR
jgi:Domain of unknown function (DUF151)